MPKKNESECCRSRSLRFLSFLPPPLLPCWDISPCFGSAPLRGQLPPPLSRRRLSVCGWRTARQTGPAGGTCGVRASRPAPPPPPASPPRLRPRPPLSAHPPSLHRPRAGAGRHRRQRQQKQTVTEPSQTDGELAAIPARRCLQRHSVGQRTTDPALTLEKVQHPVPCACCACLLEFHGQLRVPSENSVSHPHGSVYLYPCITSGAARFQPARCRGTAGRAQAVSARKPHRRPRRRPEGRAAPPRAASEGDGTRVSGETGPSPRLPWRRTADHQVVRSPARPRGPGSVGNVSHQMMTWGRRRWMSVTGCWQSTGRNTTEQTRASSTRGLSLELGQN